MRKKTQKNPAGISNNMWLLLDKTLDLYQHSFVYYKAISAALKTDLKLSKCKRIGLHLGMGVCLALIITQCDKVITHIVILYNYIIITSYMISNKYIILAKTKIHSILQTKRHRS